MKIRSDHFIEWIRKKAGRVPAAVYAAGLILLLFPFLAACGGGSSLLVDETAQAVCQTVILY